jgi:hypothetical protein
MDQSIRDAGARKTPVVAHTRNRSGWLVTMRADDWLTLIRQSDHVAASESPDADSLPFAATPTPKPSP